MSLWGKDRAYINVQKRDIKVYDGFNIKEQLSASGFSWDSFDKAWVASYDGSSNEDAVKHHVNALSSALNAGAKLEVNDNFQQQMVAYLLHQIDPMAVEPWNAAHTIAGFNDRPDWIK